MRDEVAIMDANAEIKELKRQLLEERAEKQTIVDGIHEASVRMDRKYQAVIQKMEKEHKDVINGLSKKNEELNQKLEIATEKIREFDKNEKQIDNRKLSIKNKN